METNEVLLARIDERVTALGTNLADFRFEVREHLGAQDRKIEALPSWRHAATAIGTTGLAGVGFALRALFHK